MLAPPRVTSGPRPVAKLATLLVTAVGAAAAINLALALSRFPASSFHWDETEWPRQALGILRHGVPRVDFGETAMTYPFPPALLHYPAIYGMWHPPLYLYSLAAVAFVFGTASPPLRLFGLACFVASAALLWRIVGQVGDHDLPRLGHCLPIALALLSPLVLQGIFWIDIDNTVLATALLLFISCFLSQPHSTSPARLVGLGGLFALTLACKLTTPYLLLASIPAYHLLNRNWRLALVQPVVIGAIGTGLFAAGYAVYCELLDYPWRYMFEFTFVRVSTHNGLLDELRTLDWYLAWISPSLVGLAVATSATRAFHFWRSRRAAPLDFLLIFAWLNAAAYVLWIGAEGKYMVPGTLAAMVVAGIELGRAIRTARVTRPGLLAGVLVAVAALAIAVAPLQTRWPAVDYHTLGLARMLLANPTYLYKLLAIAGLVAFSIGLTRSLVAESGLALVAIACALFASVSLPIETAKVVTSPDDRSPYRVQAGEHGFDQMTAYLQATLGPDDLTIAPKDVGFYMHTPFVPSDRDLAAGDPPTPITEVADEPACRYLVENVDFPHGPVPLELVASSKFVELTRFGSYVLYQKVSPPQPG